MLSELTTVIDSCTLVKSHPLLLEQFQFSKTTLLTKLESELDTEVCSDCNPQMQTTCSSQTVTNKLAIKKKRSKARTGSFKGESGLELIQEDINDHERCSPVPAVERLNTASLEQHRRSPRKQRGITTGDSDSSDDDNDDFRIEQILPAESRGLSHAPSRKRSRTTKISRLMALHNQMPSEEYDGDYEDEIPTPAVSFDITDRVFEYAPDNMPTTQVEVHNLLKRSRSSDSSTEASNDSACLIPDKPATSSGRKTSFDRCSISTPNVMFNQLIEPLRQSKTESSNSFKGILLKDHSSSYESNV